MNGQTTVLNTRLNKHATEIVAAYVSSNDVSSSELLALIDGVRSTLARLSTTDCAPTEAEAGKPTPVQIAKSITPDALISFIDGMPYQTLKRHLTANGLNPSRYRIQYSLPPDYPMVAPSYSARRTEISRRIHHKKSRLI